MPESLQSLFDHCKAVIFDLDGTLINSLDVWSRVDETLIRRLTGRTPDPGELHAYQQQSIARHRNLPNPYTGYCTDLGRTFGLNLSGEQIHKERFALSRQMLAQEVMLKDGAAELLLALKARGKRLALATTTRRSNVDIYSDTNENIRSRVHFRQMFESILAMEDVRNKKPDPEVYLKTLEALGLKACECLVIEDSLEGVRAASAAGITVIAVAEKWSAGDAAQIARITRWSSPSLTALLETMRPETAAKTASGR